MKPEDLDVEFPCTEDELKEAIETELTRRKRKRLAHLAPQAA